MRIALTGGIACGKSLVARYLNELGVETIDADDIVHELIPDPAERRRLAAEVFADPEKRKALEAKLHPLVKERIDAFLEEGQRTEDRGQTKEDPTEAPAKLPAWCGETPHLRRGGVLASPDGRGFASASTVQPSTFDLRPRLAIIPLLFETHWDSDYDIICCVRSARATQIARMMDTRGYTREEAEARLAAQMPVEEKAEKSHYVIENDGSVEELKKEVVKFVEWMKKEMEKSSNRANRRIVE